MLKGNTAGDGSALEVEVAQLLAQHDLGGQTGHGDVAHLGNQGYGAGGPGVGLQDVDHVISDGVLNIHQAHHVKLHRDAPGVFIDGVQVFGRDADRRDNAG